MTSSARSIVSPSWVMMVILSANMITTAGSVMIRWRYESGLTFIMISCLVRVDDVQFVDGDTIAESRGFTTDNNYDVDPYFHAL